MLVNYFFLKKNSKILTTHCPNSGSMLGLLKKGNRSWISKSDNIKRKLKYSLEIINDVKPKKTYLTHIAPQMGFHRDTEKLLPKSVSLAYDGLEFEI